MPQGFTIVETLIVLTITAVIFLSAMLVINGKQNAVEFSQSINDIQTRLQQTISEVANGFYPNSSDFNCSLDSSGNVNVVAGSTKQGENVGCVFLGKALQLNLSTDPSSFMTYTIIGSGQQAAYPSSDPNQPSREASNYQAAQAQILGGGGVASAEPVAAKLHNGITVHDMWSCPTGSPVSQNSKCPGSSSSIYAVGLLESLAHYSNQVAVNSSSQSQQVLLVPLNVTSSQDQPGGTSTINSDFSSGRVDARLTTGTAAVQICFQSGTTQESGLVTIGGANGQQLSVSLVVKENTDCH